MFIITDDMSEEGRVFFSSSRPLPATRHYCYDNPIVGFMLDVQSVHL